MTTFEIVVVALLAIITVALIPSAILGWRVLNKFKKKEIVETQKVSNAEKEKELNKLKSQLATKNTALEKETNVGVAIALNDEVKEIKAKIAKLETPEKK